MYAPLSLKIQGLPDVFDQEMMKVWDELYDLSDDYTDRWLSSGRLNVLLMQLHTNLIICL